jgi:carbonic anhydrase
MTDPLLGKTAVQRRNFFEKEGELLTNLIQQGQSPEALFIACADSRVTPEQFLEAKPGALFMLRNIANIIPPYHQTEIGTASVLEFAVLRLEVPHIIVCGHTDCGGIKGLDEDIDLSREPALARWLELARPAKRDIDLGFHDLPEVDRHLAIVERNVVNQLQNIQTYPFIRKLLELEKLDLHGWVYHLEKQQISSYDPVSNQFIPSN